MEALPDRADVVVVGAGIVGLATARAVQAADPDLVVAVVEAEDRVAAHQSGHNSGVVHAGLYYRPGSAKAELCRAGRAELLAWCDNHGVPHQRLGKVVVATRPDELGALDQLAERGRANGLALRRIDPDELRAIEPHATGLAALHVPETEVVDFAAVCRGLAADVVARGGSVTLGCPVRSMARAGAEVVVTTALGTIAARRVANCAGLSTDRVAAAAGDRPEATIAPFRGEYHELVASRRHLVRGLIYPVPDPRFPFLGVHLTRGVDGSVHVGPNAVLALSRHGYRWRDVRAGDVADLARSPATWRLAGRYWRTGALEVGRSLSRRALARAVARLVPEVVADDLVPAGSGVRAQALAADGTLVDDFAFAGDRPEPGRGAQLVHVVNAPSPAATASLAIGRVVAGRLLGRQLAVDPAWPDAPGRG